MRRVGHKREIKNWNEDRDVGEGVLPNAGHTEFLMKCGGREDRGV